MTKSRFFRFSKIEIRDLIKAWIAISIAFAICLNGFSADFKFLLAFAIAGLTVGLGFLLHELSHKFLAIRYGCIAEFRSYDTWLVLAIIFSFFGFIFAAPGGVFIAGHVDKIRNGRISAAGIAANIILALIFLAIFFLSGSQLLSVIAYYGMYINSWLALFNLIPILNFDGAKVLRWNKKIYALMIVVAAGLMVAQHFMKV